MTARCVPEGSHGCDNSALWDTRFLNESLSLVFRHFDAGSEGEVPGCNLATYLGNRNGAITTRTTSGLEHPGRFGNPFTKNHHGQLGLKPFWLKGWDSRVGSLFGVYFSPLSSLPHPRLTKGHLVNLLGRRCQRVRTRGDGWCASAMLEQDVKRLPWKYGWNCWRPGCAFAHDQAGERHEHVRDLADFWTAALKKSLGESDINRSFSSASSRGEDGKTHTGGDDEKGISVPFARDPFHCCCHVRYWAGEKMVQRQELRLHHTKGWRRGRVHPLETAGRYQGVKPVSLKCTRDWRPATRCLEHFGTCSHHSCDFITSGWAVT